MYRRVEDQLFRLPHVDERGGAAAGRDLGEAQRLTPRCQRARRHVELPIERPHFEIGARHLADEAGRHRAPAPFAGDQASPRRFGGAAELAPKVNLPYDACGQLEVIDLVRIEREGDGALRRAGARRTGAGIDGWKLVRTGGAQLRPRLQDARRRDAHVEVLLQRGPNQFLQLLVLEQVPPCLIANRHGVRRGGLEWRRRTVGIRDRDNRPLVVWSHRTSRGGTGNHKNDHRSHVRLPL